MFSDIRELQCFQQELLWDSFVHISTAVESFLATKPVHFMPGNLASKKSQAGTIVMRGKQRKKDGERE